jgi:ammonia channel protein AmtB
MEHHHTAKKENIDNLYYLVGLIAGLVIAACIEISAESLIIGAIVGFLFSVFFLNVLVKGREDI